MDLERRIGDLWRRDRRSTDCHCLLQAPSYPSIAVFRFSCSVPCFGTGNRALGQFCKPGGIWKFGFKSVHAVFPYAVYIEESGEWHQATFFYESMWNVCLFAIMPLLSRKPPRWGAILCLYLTGYGLGRFIIEGLRTDSLYLFPGLRVSQLLSSLLFLSGLGMYFFKIRKEPGVQERK